MKLKSVRLVGCVVVLMILIAGMYYTEQLRCFFVPCRDIISVKGPDQYGDIKSGTEGYITDRREQGTIQHDNNTVTNVARKLSSKDIKNYSTFGEALKDRADENKVITLLSVDAGYIDMALNILETSLLKLGINNFLFVCSDELSVQLLNAANVSCFLRKVTFGKDASNYGSRAFVQKTHIKTHIILDALQLEYTVFILDVDILLFKNPMPYLNCKKCDIQIQTDGREGNTGFYLVRPTKPGIEMHRKAIDMSKRSTSTTNQMALDRTMEKMIKGKAITARYLDVKLFPHGQEYFEKGKRAFAGDNPCKQCVMVHNNWLVSGAAKTYRFKEHLMWTVDRNQYYSNPDNKYLTYNNPLDIDSNKETIEAEKNALRNALAIGHVLNRIVILPSFHCYTCKYQVCQNPAKRCPLNTHLQLKKFDTTFSGLYREHVFLQHDKVPHSTKQSTSDLVLINSDILKSHKGHSSFTAVKLTFHPKDPAKGATSEELVEWFKQFDDTKVLRFHSMYNTFKEFSAEHQDKDFEQKLVDGFKKSDYRQY